MFENEFQEISEARKCTSPEHIKNSQTHTPTPEQKHGTDTLTGQKPHI